VPNLSYWTCRQRIATPANLVYNPALRHNGGTIHNNRKAWSRPMSTLTGKVAVITGSTRGLGLAIAQTYAAAGAAVIISSRTASAVDAAVESFRAEGYQAAGLACDVADLKQVQALRQLALDTFGGLDIWVNNAGMAGAYGPTLGVPPERFMQVIQTNIVGTYFGSRIAMQHFLSQGRGKLINMLGRGDRKPVPMQNAYAPSKVWVRSFTLALAKEYKKSGVGVFAFNPGLVDTDMLRQIDVVPGHEGDVNPLRTVIRLWGNEPSVPAQKALWLASAATDGKTGLEINVLTRTAALRGVLAEGLRRVTGRAGEPVELVVKPVGG
jgi:NAD(P)-dependent dehydrogenase (short-subunit alcohol dehydrogenase family)